MIGRFVDYLKDCRFWVSYFGNEEKHEKCHVSYSPQRVDPKLIRRKA